MTQTILGAGGAIGKELAKALPQYTEKIRLVSRNPKKVNPTDELISADVMDKDALFNAIQGSSVVYITVGFPYSTKAWESHWPMFMKNTIAACRESSSRLVFFDNIYMYDPTRLGDMDESTPINPCNKKGQVRTTIANMLMDEVESGHIQALIARCADYYGPAIQHTSALTEMVISKLVEGKRPQWMRSLDYKHSMTYVPDAGKATALLGTTDDAFNQVWHLPTADNPPTGQGWIDMIAKELDVELKPQVISHFMLKSLGLFVPILKELAEMSYQYSTDYVFKSHKFEKRFKVNPTSYSDGIKETVLHGI